jgi:alpha-glucosidase
VSTQGDVLTVRSVGADETVRCVVNMGSETVLVRCRGTLLMASTAHVHHSAGSVALPPNAAVWLVED